MSPFRLVHGLLAVVALAGCTDGGTVSNPNGGGGSSSPPPPPPPPPAPPPPPPAPAPAQLVVWSDQPLATPIQVSFDGQVAGMIAVGSLSPATCGSPNWVTISGITPGSHRVTATGQRGTSWDLTLDFPSTGGCFSQRLVAQFGELSIIGEGSGDGTVKSVTSVIDCGIDAGAAATGSCYVTWLLGTSFGLTATPKPGFTFDGWGGDCAGTSPQCIVQLNGTRTVRAGFSRTPLANGTLVLRGTGSGHITSSAAGISCLIVSGVTNPATCTIQKPPGTTVTLIAGASSPTPVFAGWSGACSGFGIACTLTLVEPVTVGADFLAAAPMVRLETLPVGNGQGVVYANWTPPNGPGIQCFYYRSDFATGSDPEKCRADFPIGTVVNLIAFNIDSDSFFDRWFGNNACAALTTNTCTFTLTVPTSVFVEFNNGAHSIGSLPSNGGSGGGAGGGTGGGEMPGTSGSGGVAGSATGRYVYSCTATPPLGVSTAWIRLPAPFNGLHYRFRTFDIGPEVFFANQYTQRINFSYEPSRVNPATRTGYRTSLAAGYFQDRGRGVDPGQAPVGSRICIRVDQVRFGTDTGPYN